MKSRNGYVGLTVVGLVLFAHAGEAAAQSLTFRVGGSTFRVGSNRRFAEAPPVPKKGGPGPKARVAPKPDARLKLVDPHLEPRLPRLGFASFTIRGYGERVTFVRPGSPAHRLGLERGDTILAINHCRLTYHGAWDEALREAIQYHDGWISLAIRDVRTGRVAYRSMNLFDYGHAGPITHKHRR